MLKSLMNRVRRQNGPDVRHTRSRLLLDYLDAHGSLILDKKGLSALGMSKKQVFQTVYGLVLRESIQMRAEEDGTVMVMSNIAYAELLERRAQEASDKNAGRIADGETMPEPAFAEEKGIDPEIYAFSRNSLPVRSREPWIAVENISFDFE